MITTIGILQCGQVKEELRPQFGDNTQMLMRWLSPQIPGVQFKLYRVFSGELPAGVHECQCYIITGSAHSVYDDLPWVGGLLQFILQLNECKKKMLGICFGHQAIAQALGGAVEKCVRGWGLGILQSEVLSMQPWMMPPLQKLYLIASHQDQVTQLPEGALRLAGSDFCPNYFMQYQEHFLGLQGHPEWPKEYLTAVIHSRIATLTPEQYQIAAESLQHVPASQLVAQWVACFLLR